MSEKVDKCEVVGFQSLNAFSPALVSFEYGFHSLTDKSDLNCNLYVDPNNHQERTVIVSKNDQHFLGKLPSEDPLSHTLLLVRNKKTNKARVFMSQSCSLVNSAREEENLKRKNAAQQKNIEERDWKSQYHRLTQSFGSKKSKRASGVTMKLNLDMSMTADEIKDTVADIDIKLDELNTSDQGEEDLLRLLPPCNRSASSPENVYSINDILTQEERESLREAAEFLINNGVTEADEKNNYFLYSHYLSLGNNPNLEKVELLIYGNSLVKFFNLSAGEMRSQGSSKKICPWSRIISTKILKEFTVLSNNVRTRPSYCKDKIVCYLMVTLLLACNFKLSIEVLSSCLKGFGQKKLIQLARVVGLTFVKGNTKEYSLKVPLAALPKLRQPKRKSI